MSKKILGWDSADTMKFLAFLSKNTGAPRLTIFKKYAKESARQPMSIRNYFYVLREEVKKDENLRAELEKKFNLGEIFGSIHFEHEEEMELLKKILPTKNQPSVRQACRRLAGGDETLMIRLQNKYHSLVRENKTEVQKVVEKLKGEGIEVREPYKNNIISMPRKNVGDDDIKLLFSGLMKLIKKSAEEDAKREAQRELKFVSETLQNTLVDLRRKEFLVEELKEKNKKLRQEFSLIQNSLAKSQAENLSNMLEVKSLVESDKMKDLKNFLSSLSLKETEVK